MSSTEESGADLPGGSRAGSGPVSLHRPCFFKREGRTPGPGFELFPPTEEGEKLLPGDVGIRWLREGGGRWRKGLF